MSAVSQLDSEREVLNVEWNENRVRRYHSGGRRAWRTCIEDREGAAVVADAEDVPSSMFAKSGSRVVEENNLLFLPAGKSEAGKHEQTSHSHSCHIKPNYPPCFSTTMSISSPSILPIIPKEPTAGRH